MSDIQPGDVVVCVDASRPKHFHLPLVQRPMRALVVGKIYRVTRAFCSPNGSPVVLLDGEPPIIRIRLDNGWDVQRFRKIRPADPEFIELVKRVKEPVA